MDTFPHYASQTHDQYAGDDVDGDDGEERDAESNRYLDDDENDADGDYISRHDEENEEDHRIIRKARKAKRKRSSSSSSPSSKKKAPTSSTPRLQRPPRISQSTRMNRRLPPGNSAGRIEEQNSDEDPGVPSGEEQEERSENVYIGEVALEEEEERAVGPRFLTAEELAQYNRAEFLQNSRVQIQSNRSAILNIEQQMSSITAAKVTASSDLGQSMSHGNSDDNRGDEQSDNARPESDSFDESTFPPPPPKRARIGLYSTHEVSNCEPPDSPGRAEFSVPSPSPQTNTTLSRNLETSQGADSAPNPNPNTAHSRAESQSAPVSSVDQTRPQSQRNQARARHDSEVLKVTAPGEQRLLRPPIHNPFAVDGHTLMCPLCYIFNSIDDRTLGISRQLWHILEHDTRTTTLGRCVPKLTAVYNAWTSDLRKQRKEYVHFDIMTEEKVRDHLYNHMKSVTRVMTMIQLENLDLAGELLRNSFAAIIDNQHRVNMPAIAGYMKLTQIQQALMANASLREPLLQSTDPRSGGPLPNQRITVSNRLPTNSTQVTRRLRDQPENR